MKTWHRGRLWLDIWNPFGICGWSWSFHTWPCCILFIEGGFFCFVIGRHQFDWEDE
jgi:hypothetical protein